MDRLIRLFWVGSVQNNEPSRVRKWERLEQNAVHYAENGAVHANAERQTQHGDDGEAGVAGERAKGVTEVVEHLLSR